jgi:HSP20 family protein
MSIVRWEPLRDLTALQSDMNRLFNSAFAGPSTTMSQRWLPAMDLIETAEDYVLRADVPGLRLDDVKLEIEDTVLTVSGERRLESESDGGGYHRLERSFGSFSRALTLPKGVDAEAVTAALADGVLEVHIPKPAEKQPRRIEIAVGDKPATIDA